MTQNRVMKTSVCILMLLLILIQSTSLAQTQTALQVDGAASVNVSPANIIWEKTYGGEGDDRALNVIPIQDGFIVVGSTESIITNKTVGWALRLNSEGNTVWNKTYLNGAGTELRCAVNLTDGFLLVGNQFSETGDVNGYVAKTDSQGNLIWQTVLGQEKIDKLFSGAASNDDFVVFGLSYSYGNNQGASWIVKLDEDGQVLWNKTYNESVESALRSGIATKEGSYIAAGYIDPSGEADYDFYFIKVASDGSLLWNKTYTKIESQKAYSMTTAKDGYVLAGETVSTQTSTDALILKVDFEGNKIWETTIGGPDSDSPSYITPSQDDGFLVCGFTFSFGAGQRDFWLIKISALGQVEFSATYGTPAFEEAYSVIDTGDGAYVMSGWADPANRPDLIGKALYNFEIVKLEVANANSQPISWFAIYGIVIFAIIVAIAILIVKLKKK